MNYNEFCEEINLTVQSIAGPDYKVSVMKVNKLNGVILHSLIIQKDGENVTPNIYLEDHYTKYLQGRTINSLAAEVMSFYFQTEKCSDLPFPAIMDFDTVKDKLFIKLINYDKNKELLKTIPYVKWLDLAVVFSVLVKKDSEGVGSFYVNNDLMERWEVNIETIYNCAMSNTPQLLGRSIRMMDDIIKDMLIKYFNNSKDRDSFDTMLDAIQSEQHNGSNKMYVASNTYGINGAVWLLYKNDLQALSKQLNSDLYLLPSSIHEIIIIKADDKLQRDQLLNMVREVNDTQVPEQEVLSDNVYLYNRETDTIYPMA